MSRLTRGPRCFLPVRGCHPLWLRFPAKFPFLHSGHWPGPLSLATTNGVSFDVLSSGYLDVSVPRVRLLNLWIQFKIPLRVGFPIRKSSDQSLFAAPRSISQRTTSFIASQRQGIHQIPFRHLIALIVDAHPSAEVSLRAFELLRDKHANRSGSTHSVFSVSEKRPACFMQTIRGCGCRSPIAFATRSR